MKIWKRILAFVCAAVLSLTCAACGERDLPLESTVTVSGESAPSESAATLRLKIETPSYGGTYGTILGVGLTEGYGEAYTFGFTQDILEESGRELLPGMIVDVGFDGSVMETWPEQIVPESIAVVEQGEGFFPLYMDMLEYVYGKDTGLNPDDGAEQIVFGFDFTEVHNLTDTEKDLLAFVFSSARGADYVLGTWQELVDEGYIEVSDGAFYSWKGNGAHFTVSDEECAGNSFRFSMSKWGTSLGALGYDDCTARKKGGVWRFDEPTSAWIS